MPACRDDGGLRRPESASRQVMRTSARGRMVIALLDDRRATQVAQVPERTQPWPIRDEAAEILRQVDDAHYQAACSKRSA